MTKKLEFTNSFLLNDLRRDERKIQSAQRKAVVLAGGNCLMCKHTKMALGKRLLCRIKDKLVSQYNYCEKFQQLVFSGPEETDEAGTGK